LCPGMLCRPREPGRTARARTVTLRSLLAGGLYAIIVFAAGFVLGVLRVLVLAPALGEAAAVALELPVILVLAWLASAWIGGRLAIPPRAGARLSMGLAALVVVLAADLALGVFLMGQPLDTLAARYGTAPGLAGLGGQLFFAAIPVLQARIAAHR